jgi:hypothetical protein
MCTPKGTQEDSTMTTFKNFKNQVARIQNQNDLIDAHIAICQAYSAYKLTHKQFDELRDAMILKRLEKKIAWGQGI